VARVTDDSQLGTTQSEVAPADLAPAVVGVMEASSPAGSAMTNRSVDRRQVTILFADLSGFTALSERLDPEEVHSFQNVLFDAFSQAITRYDGYVAKFLGDAVLALFGAPAAHEDDPARALYAALDMLACSAGLSEQWAARLGQPVVLHMAVHTGPVVAGSLGGAGAAAYDVTGDTVNTAARLLEAAAPGTILVSDATHVLTRHRFAFEPAGELTLRGKAAPMVAHELRGVLSDSQSWRGLAAHGLAAPMVGRDDELEQLLAAFDRMQHGRAQVINLIGEAGTGKSRLIAEFLRRLEGEGRLACTALRRADSSSLGEPPYGVFATLFREGYQVNPDDPLDVARQKLAAGLRSLGAPTEVTAAIVPVLSYLLAVEEARPIDLDPEQLRRQIALAARTLVERRLQQTPVLMVVEDLHWADAASVDLLRDIVDHLADRPLMLLVSQRPDIPVPLTACTSQITIRLTPLRPEEIQTLVTRLFDRADEETLARIQHLVATRAGGSPLFVEEIVRSLVSTGVLVRQGDRWTCTRPCDAVNIPPTLHGLLLSRIDRLPADLRRLLQEAAVLGMIFDEALLHAVVTDKTNIGTALERLVASEVIQEFGPGRDGKRYRFTHALVHEAVYENLLLSRRSELHERAGQALERAVGPHPSQLSDFEALGHHWSLASEQHKPKGARYLATAGDRARAIYANDDAIRHYQRALQTLADRPSDEQVQTVRERLADLLALTGQRAEAHAHYEALRQALEAASDRAGVARLNRKTGCLYWEGGDHERAKACFASGLEQLGEDGSPIERAHLFQELGRLAFRSGDNAGAITWAERALAEMVNEEGIGAGPERTREMAALQAQAYNTLSVALAHTSRLDEAVTKIEQSIDIAEAHDLLQAACRGYANLGVLYSSLDPRRCIETCLRGLETAKKTGDLGFQSRLYANLAVAYCALTDRCEADGIAAAQLAVNLDRRLGLLDHLAVPLIVLGQIHQCHGDHASAFAAYEEALALAERLGDPQLLFPCYDGLATLHLDAGTTALAEVYLVKAQEVCERAGLEPDALLTLPFLA
jgi:predicted ATPase/class 3 adenylate cyclase